MARAGLSAWLWLAARQRKQCSGQRAAATKPPCLSPIDHALCPSSCTQLGKGQLPHEASAPLADALIRLVTKQHSYFYPLVMRYGAPDPRDISLSFAVDPETGEEGVALEFEEPVDSAPGWVQGAARALRLLVAHLDSTALAVTKDMVQRLFRHRDEAVGSEQHFK